MLRAQVDLRRSKVLWLDAKRLKAVAQRAREMAAKNASALEQRMRELARQKVPFRCAPAGWVWVGGRVGSGRVRELARQKVPFRCGSTG